MRWSPIVVASLFSLVSWTAEAHPAPVSYSNSTARSLHKRSIVCGINLRTATADDCLTKHSVVNFKLSGTGTRIQVTKEAVAANAVAAPAGSACDHVVELQVLAKAMQQSEVCGIISALNALDQHRNVVLQPLADIINDSENLFFLASDVNRAKASYVQLAIGNQVIKSSENQFFIAMESYLRTAEVASASRKVAGQCDTEIATIVNHATALAATFPAPPPAGTRAQGEQILQNNLRAALKAHADQKADEKITVVNLWNRALLGKVVNE